MNPVPTARAVRLAQAAARVRADALLAALDAALAAVALRLAPGLAPDGGGSSPSWLALAATSSLVLVAGVPLGLYGQMWRHAGLHEARRVLLAAALWGLALLSLSALGEGGPVAEVVVAAVLWLVGAGAVRFQSRLFALSRRARPDDSTRTVVLGAGSTGASLVREALADPDQGLVPVALLDDDSRTAHRSHHGVPVLGTFDDLPRVARETRAQQVVLAVPHASPEVVRRVIALAEAARLPLRRVAPRVSPAGGRPSGGDRLAVRDLSIDDLLGRSPVVTDLAAVRALLADKRVLVTGAGGSIGSEIARQVAAAAPSALLLLDHDETHLFDVRATLPTAAVEELLADVRDAALLERLFLRHRPQVVFHAAAHKHVPLLEKHPGEAVATNVLGTANVVRAARRAGVPRMVFVSTDKAVEPRSVMGASKRIGEHVVLTAAGPGRQWCAVRFGNVLGSRGSVLPTFLRQIEEGGPVTVTDPRMTRFFMSIPEAVQLVLQAAAMARGGEVYTLEMGQPVSVLGLATQVVRLSGRRPGHDVEVRVVGARPGEKLHERLHAEDEHPGPTAHPAVREVRRQLPPAAEVERTVARLAAVREDDGAARAALLAAANDGRLPVDPPAVESPPVLVDLRDPVDLRPDLHVDGLAGRRALT